ncbi:hypothetical protein AB0I84_03430 [Streptomyces spectabilis]|uniref:Uncharacterized protein n=1 Tax=Streptomyces spectabilis TaxID=68270 RepID=A0A5P2XK43_STRST|nr:hypothetical protein [Streptomyces spectabilis]MBB5109281.1 hypothetical protein [Streptomyces spectabilis]MCI3905981.1 hypothetical protein [Streptomyces spectabilis]QEV62886.1 hypothetical protein CP982_32730 [Streptomyces spectabilis]GGV05554.1 hypothetical protein GCM10010245_11550 [Streptomyces spectabilis]
MKKLLEGIGFVLFVQGVAGLVHEFTGWLRGWGVVQHLGFADGYELYLSIALIVLAVALFAAAESVEKAR